MKPLAFSIFSFFAFVATSLGQMADSVVLIVNVTAPEGPLNLYRFTGLGFERLQVATKPAPGDPFEFKVSASDPQFYYLGASPMAVKPLLAGPEDTLRVNGNWKNIQGLQLVNSPLNRAYGELQQNINGVRARAQRASRSYAAAEGMARDSLQEILKQTDQEQLSLLEKTRQEDPFMARVMALNTYLSFPNHQGKYRDEASYFANEYFAHADLEDPGYNGSPWIFQSFSIYTRTLASVNFPADTLKTILETQLDQTKGQAGVYQMAFSGVVSALKQAKHPSFVHFAEQYTRQFAAAYPEAAGKLKKDVEAARMLEIGSLAPAFAQLTPQGDTLGLETLRGQVVLLDFWASWCGPCRRENPNVVRMYNRFKEQGFTILGVSLDKNRDRWLGAIEKDQLEWYHVSDLKGWSNKVAQQYQVNSIPQTFLLDRDGKIIARNLRGKALEKKLEEIFAEP